MKGRLKERPLEILFHDIPVRAPSGVLTLERGPVKKQICFVKGTVRFAASNLKEDRLGEYLVRTGAIAGAVIQQFEARLAPGARLVETLLAEAVLSADDLRQVVHGNVLDTVLPCFDWRTGQYRYAAGTPNIIGEIATDIPVVEFHLERSRRRAAGEDVAKLLPAGEATLALSVPSLRDLPRMTLTQAETLVLSRAEAGESLSTVLAVAPAIRQEMARAVWAFIESGLVSVAARPSYGEATVFDTLPPGMKKRESRVSEPQGGTTEVRYYRQMYDLLLGSDHYRTLGIETTATAEEIRRAYYALAKEIHPDRFLSPPLDVLHREMEELFSQVLEAYNTLLDDGDRARYDTDRAAGSAGAAKTATAEQQALAKFNFLRGRTAFDEGKMVDALRFLTNAVEIEPSRPEYLRLLGTVQARNPRLRTEAEATLLKAIEIDPARPDAYLQLGLLYRKMGEPSKAIECLRDCLKWDPSNIEAGTALAEMARTVGNRN